MTRVSPTLDPKRGMEVFEKDGRWWIRYQEKFYKWNYSSHARADFAAKTIQQLWTRKLTSEGFEVQHYFTTDTTQVIESGHEL